MAAYSSVPYLSHESGHPVKAQDKCFDEGWPNMCDSLCNSNSDLMRSESPQSINVAEAFPEDSVIYSSSYAGESKLSLPPSNILGTDSPSVEDTSLMKCQTADLSIPMKDFSSVHCEDFQKRKSTDNFDCTNDCSCDPSSKGHIVNSVQPVDFLPLSSTRVARHAHDKIACDQKLLGTVIKATVQNIPIYSTCQNVSAKDSKSVLSSEFDCTKTKEMVAKLSQCQSNIITKHLGSNLCNSTYPKGPATNKNWGIPTGLGLFGGGENSNGSTPLSGQTNAFWSHNGNPNSNVQSQWSNGNRGSGSSVQVPNPTNQSSTNMPKSSSTGSTSWAQAAGKGLPTTNSQPSNDNQKQQLERINSIREALLATDGWGGNHVNQETGWDLPLSPPRSPKDESGRNWKTQINNGTELWENNLRNGGQVRQEPQKAPWGHTPSSAFGGTWGEEDDMENSNLWTGATSSGSNQWGTNQSNMWGSVPKKEGDWTAGTHSSANNWNDPNQRLNTESASWEQRNKPPQPQPAPQWNTSSIKEPKPSGWEEPSPPSQRRVIPPNYDDGTAVWGNPTQQPNPTVTDKVSHWREMPQPNVGRSLPSHPNAPAPGRISVPTNSMKPEGPMWARPNCRASWNEGSHESGWAEESKSANVTSWGDHNWGNGPVSGINPNLGPKPKTPVAPSNPAVCGWEGDVIDTSGWVPPKQVQKPISKEAVWASKQFRMLVEMGFKKEEVEAALKNSNLVMEEAIVELSQGVGRLGLNGPLPGSDIDNWCDHNHSSSSPFDVGPHNMQNMPPNFGGPGSCPGQRFGPGPAQQSMPYNPQAPCTNTPSLLNPGSNPNISNINPALMQRLIPQPVQQQSPQPQVPPFQQGGRAPQNNPSTAQLRVLVQQIQMAVSAGHLNPQILNQPLAPQTLILLNQLLQQIKMLQQLTQQQTFAQTQCMQRGHSQTALQISVQITKTKQQIANLQNQIAAQQAIYIKQQQQPPMGPGLSGPPNQETFRHNGGDTIAGVSENLAALTMNPSQSRLAQWLNKEEGNEFSRAPGTIGKGSGMVQSHSSLNFNPLMDSTWSNLPRSSDSGWPDSNPITSEGHTAVVHTQESQWGSSNTSSQSTNSQTYSLADLPEFEPGKPWKGNQLKNIEDDPTITPGSVARSPIAMATIKDTEIFTSANKSSPVSSAGDNSLTSLSLSSSTWSFPPPGGSRNLIEPSGFVFSNKSGLGMKNKYNDFNHQSTLPASDIWGAPKPRGPPPGLSNSVKGNWGGLSASNGSHWAWNEKSSAWLMLKNLSPQIDYNTLRTLCMQHGPVIHLQLFSNFNMALVKYSSKEDLAKAQVALNNCVLGNTAMVADVTSDAEAQAIVSGQPPSSWSNGASNSNSGMPIHNSAKSTDHWGGSHLWPSAIWADNDQSHSNSTPFLPGDLLSGESM